MSCCLGGRVAGSLVLPATLRTLPLGGRRCGVVRAVQNLHLAWHFRFFKTVVL
jgi:hypothetical protein|eukprot:COSAG01_NODE_2550_length_7464_cov_14.290699_5_plen_53_part_00